jgi:hypothetical protein
LEICKIFCDITEVTIKYVYLFTRKRTIDVKVPGKQERVLAALWDPPWDRERRQHSRIGYGWGKPKGSDPSVRCHTKQQASDLKP